MKLQEIKRIDDRDLFLNKQIDQASIGEVSKKIIEINRSDDKLKKYSKLEGFEYNPNPINIYIDSYGGNVYQCLGLLSIMDKSKTPIHTYVTGAAMSAGFMILIHGHKRFGYKLSTPLYHQPSGIVWGTSKDIKDNAKEYKRLRKLLEKLTLERTNISKKKLRKVYKTKKDWFMTAKEAKKLGVIDKIL